jgi:hypothetical protein
VALLPVVAGIICWLTIYFGIRSVRRELRRTRLTGGTETIPIGNLGEALNLGDYDLRPPPLRTGYASIEAALQSPSYSAIRRRSMALLREWLTPAQRLDLDHAEAFYVTGNVTGVRYAISAREPSSNVHVFDDRGREVCRICFLPGGGVPYGDVLLGQKMALELDERSALAVAIPDKALAFVDHVLARLPEVDLREIKRRKREADLEIPF